MYCKNCGSNIDTNSFVCSNCGMPYEEIQNPNNDTGNFGWGILGCCLPIVGLILFLVWKDNKPKDAKSAGIGALVAVGIYTIFYILLFLFTAILF